MRAYYSRGGQRVYAKSTSDADFKRLVKQAEAYATDMGRKVAIMVDDLTIGKRAVGKTFAGNPAIRGQHFSAEEWRVQGNSPQGRPFYALASSKREANDTADQMRAMGYKRVTAVQVQGSREKTPKGHGALDVRRMAANPSTKASVARRKAANKRGAYVEYIDGTTKKRILYGNKGIATIRAAAMKKDGWRGVRVLMA